jgi:hypothetical protein
MLLLILLLAAAGTLIPAILLSLTEATNARWRS